MLLICGKKVLQELPKAYRVKTLFVTEDAKIRITAEEKYTVTDGIMKKITNHKNPEPYAAIVEAPIFENFNARQVLICDQIKDPGNLGTLIRTALGMGFDAVYLLGDCVDPYNEKVISASRGALFLIPILSGNWDNFLKFKQLHNLNLYQADLGGKSFLEVKTQGPVGLIMGSEAHGTSDEAKKFATTLSIPMTSKTESLNVAVAGGILMFHVSTVCQKI